MLTIFARSHSIAVDAYDQCDDDILLDVNVSDTAKRHVSPKDKFHLYISFALDEFHFHHNGTTRLTN